eukprot:scaffold644_cov168-Ochromonas_danica.AAC.5
MMKVQGCIQKSTDIMHTMNQYDHFNLPLIRLAALLVKVKEVSATMQAMAREMEHSGLIEEIIGDTMEALDDESLNQVADAEVDRIVQELTAGVFEGTGATPNRAIRTSATAEPAAQQQEAAKEEQATADLLQRLQAL